MNTEQKVIPVVDGSTGADIYGYAASAEGAVKVAEKYFVDEVSHAELDGPINLSDGTQIPQGWIVLTRHWVAETEKL